MKRFIVFLILQFVLFSTYSQKKDAFTLFNSKGKKVSYAKMLKQLDKGDIILFGELHNNPIAHWLQYELTRDLGSENELVLGAEMFEADNQVTLTRYLSGEIDDKGLDTLARLWPNYHTDYAPLVNFAKDNQLNFVATNIPRRYANQVYKKGFEMLDSLSAEEKAWIAPLPMPFDAELPRYKNILSMMGVHGTPGIVKAQATKDATMAHFILQNYEDGKLFIHYNGAYHSDYFEGILWYLRQQNDSLTYKTISTVEQANVRQLNAESLKRADFIICVDENMTKTY